MQPFEYLAFTDSTASRTCELPNNTNITHGIIGLANEAGELLGLLKKMMFNNREITNEQIADELGDVAWYMARVLRGLDMSWEDLFLLNKRKLDKRYQGKYSDEKAKIQADYWDNSKVEKTAMKITEFDVVLTPELMRAGFNGA